MARDGFDREVSHAVVYSCPDCTRSHEGPEGEEGNYVCPDCSSVLKATGGVQEVSG
jgi:DNA-directed RNA polymerase subunit RPC12/RpoP